MTGLLVQAAAVHHLVDPRSNLFTAKPLDLGLGQARLVTLAKRSFLPNSRTIVQTTTR